MKMLAPGTMKTTNPARKVNWKFLPDAISEDEVDIQFIWYGNERTEQAIERQAKLMGFPSAYDYLQQLIAATIAGNEEDTILADDGRILNGNDGYDQDGLPQNV
jgi:hypothetical protein